MIINRRIFNFCKNYHKLTGQLPGQTNPDIKERLDNFKKLYKPVDPVYLKEQELKQLREKFIQENLESQQEQVVEQSTIESQSNNYLKFMGIFCAGMFVYLLKETYIFYTNPKNVILYDENTGKTYQTTKEEFEKIKQESKKNREYKEFRIKVLSKQQAEQLEQQVRQKNKEAAKEDGLI